MRNKKILLLSTVLLGALSLASCDKKAADKDDNTIVKVDDGESNQQNTNNQENQTGTKQETLTGTGQGNQTETNQGDQTGTSQGNQTETNQGNLSNQNEGETNVPAKVLAKANNTDGVSAKDKLDYIREIYGIEDHIFDVITIDRLNLLINPSKIDQYGKSVIVFANANNPLSKKSLEKINEEAKALGVERIYYFDLLLAGEYGVDVWDNPEATWPNTTDQTGAKVTQAFVNIKNTLKTQTSLKDINSDFNADKDVFLFVNNHQQGTSEIVNSLLIEKEEDIVQSKIEEVLGEVIDNIGNYIGTNYSDYDYFNNAIYRSQTTNNYYSSYEEFKNTFYVRSITYYELRLLLETEGTHNILFSGSWCGDSKAAIALLVEDAAKYSNGEPVYVFDFRLSNGVISGTKGQAPRETSVVDVEGLEGPNQVVTGVGYLGKAIIDAFGTFEVGKQNAELKYVVDGYESFELVDDKINTTYEVTEGQKKFRSPSLFKYNKDAENPVTDSWVHKVSATDILYKNNSGVSSYEIGDLVDYELASGALTDQQKAYGRYKLAIFLGAPEVVYNTPTISVSESDSSLDSGCGDDNDPIDNLDQDTLIPNQGTNLYDVSSYDITIELKEATLPKDALFIGKTVINAKANADLVNQISIDFRRQKITKVSLENVTKNVVLLDNISGDSLSSVISRTNIDEEDIQKLFIKFEGTIEANDVFELTVEYETTTIDNSANNSAYSQYAEGFNLHVDNKGYSAVGEPFGSDYWFPNNNTPADGANYTITLIAPTAYTAISNGVKKSSTANAALGTRTTIWEVKQDTATYQIFATFSKNITSFESTTNSKGLYVTADDKTIPLYIYVNNDLYKANRYKIDRYIGLLPLYIKTLESKFGAYQGESLGFILENVGDGHGEAASWGAIETKDRPFFTTKTVVSENTFVHEFVHQWYGDAVRISNWDNLWLNEGFATYGTALYYELVRDNYNAVDTFKRLFNNKAATSKIWSIAPAALPNESDLFGGQKSAYNRGGLALAVLREGIGDEAFFNVLSSWILSNKGTAKTTDDFINLVKSNLPSNVSSDDIDTFSRVWLYGTTKPQAFTLTGEALNR